MLAKKKRIKKIRFFFYLVEVLAIDSGRTDSSKICLKDE